MVLAGKTLFVAGAPGMTDPKDPFGTPDDNPRGVLAAFAAETGEKLSECEIPSLPVWDGLAAAGGRLYLATLDGHVLCLRGAQ